VPSKAFLHKPYPTNLPVVDICASCNSSFSEDEEYTVAFIGAVLVGTTDPKEQSHATAARILGRNEALRARIEKSKIEYRTIGGQTRVGWKPESNRVERVVVKNARGHAYFECGEPMLDEPSFVWAMPLSSLTETESDNFECEWEAGIAPWPEVGSRIMTRVLTGQDMDGGWMVVQEGWYRYSVRWQDGMQVKTVIGEYLATEVRW
jgi:hypothetical protein